MKKVKRIFLTGGGSAGHVTPNIALIKLLKDQAWSIRYLGSAKGIERELITPLQIPYSIIPTGKLRRYFSWQNFIDPFKVVLSIFKCSYLCLRYRPHAVFSKGGFVSLPVVFAAWLNRIPVVLHESDLTPGLANKLSIPFAKTICLSFAETKQFIKPKFRNKTCYTGSPIRPQLLQGDKQRGRAFASIQTNKPVLMIICGSLGSKKINQALREALPSLLEQFEIIHLCGKGNVDSALNTLDDYHQFEFIGDELGDLFACSDLVISRAGSNALYELLSLHKPHLLIPLKAGSRGDQIHNAAHFSKLGYSDVLPEDKLSSESLITAINQCMTKLEQTKKILADFPKQEALPKIISLLQGLSAQH